MNNEKNPAEERELLFELYSFCASNGKIYYLKPAPISEVMSPCSDFVKILDSIGIPIIASGENPRLFCMSALKDEDKRKCLSGIVEKYVLWNGAAVTLGSLCDDGFTVDDIILLIKRLAGISG